MNFGDILEKLLNPEKSNFGIGASEVEVAPKSFLERLEEIKINGKAALIGLAVIFFVLLLLFF